MEPIMKKKDRGHPCDIVNPLLRPLECITYTNDVETAIEAFRQACRGAESVGMQLVGDFTYTGEKHQITIQIRSANGA